MASYKKFKKKKSYIAQKALVSFLLIVCIVINSVYFVYSSLMSRINFVNPSPPVVTFTDYEVSETDLDKDDCIPEGVIVKNDDVSLYLLVGSDSRFGLKNISRSDSLIIAAVDRKHQKIKLISLMRDMLVKIAGTKGYNRINTAYANDSKAKDATLSRTRKTIGDTFGVQLDNFVVIDFGGFKKLIDMMGGVEMTLSAAEAKYMCSDKTYGNFPRFKNGAGKYNLSGAEALNYARMRHTGNSDFDRTERQRKMISAIIGKMKDQSYADLATMVTVALGYVTTNVQQGEILGLALQAPTLLSYSIAQYRLPINGSFVFKSVKLSGVTSSILWCNYKFNREQLQKFIYEDDMTYSGSDYKKPKVTIPFLPSSVKEATKATTTTQAVQTETTVA